ncbi:MAG: TRAP transporter large permease [Coriobacteriia bacterium]|nr:TRAP transporter large permease [Coriobacteriia bacterium]
MEPIAIGVIGLLGLFALLFLGVPIAWSLGMVGFAGLCCILGWSPALSFIYELPWAKMSSYGLILLPIFMFMGQLTFESGIGEQAFSVANKWVGKLPGGLAVATALAAGMFASVTGSSMAGVVTIGKAALPEMEKYGYDSRLSTGAVAACGTFGLLIPPSGLLVIYGIITEQSVGKLFFAGIVPGIVTVLIYMIMIIIRVTVKPSLAPRSEGFSWRDRLESLKDIWPIVVLAGIMLGGMYTGILTVTEAGCVGCVFSGFFLLWRAQGRVKRAFWSAFRETASIVGMIFGIVFGVTIFSGFVLLSTIPATFSSWVIALPFNKYIVLSLLLFMYIPLGMVIDPLGIVFITMPIVYPVIIAMGFSGIWFGIIIVKLIEIAMITPPVGLNVFTTKGIAPPHVKLHDIFIGILWFFVCDLITLTILVAFPQLSTWLPSTMAIRR